MKNLWLMVVVSVVFAVAVSVAWPKGATADKPSACQQWEVMVAPQMRTVTEVKSLPEPGKPFIEQSPAGWEPFAFGPNGLVYRRCAK